MNVTGYPINVRIEGRSCLVVGGGNVAIRKVGGLVAAGARVTVVAPDVHPDVAAMPVAIVERSYRPTDLAGHWLVMTCTDDPTVNHQVFLDGEAAGVLVNSADDPVNCAFTLPAVARRGDLSLAISTNGRSPALAMWLRKSFEAEFDERYDELLDLLVEVRAEAREFFGTSELRGWVEAFDDGVFDLIANDRRDHARELLRSHLGLPVLEVAS